jgi:hypothetical protein
MSQSVLWSIPTIHQSHESEAARFNKNLDGMDFANEIQKKSLNVQQNPFI